MVLNLSAWDDQFGPFFQAIFPFLVTMYIYVTIKTINLSVVIIIAAYQIENLSPNICQLILIIYSVLKTDHHNRISERQSKL